MQHVFFSSDSDFEVVCESVFQALGIMRPHTGDSHNVLGGEYAEATVLGIMVKLERNAYDYEDEFNYMISIKRNQFEMLHVSDEFIRIAAELTQSLLANKLRTRVGLENNEGTGLAVF